MTVGRALLVLVTSFVVVTSDPTVAQTTTPSAPTTAPTTAASIPPPELEPLIAKLSDGDWKVRTAAQDAIVALGDDATARLQQLQSESDDAEVRTAAESMLARIAQGRLTGPTLVTLHLKDATGKQAFEALSRQINTELRIWPEGLWEHHKPGPITIDADRRPFWAVLKELCEKTLVTPREMGQAEPFTLMQGSDGQMSGPNVTSGAFLIVANSATESKSIRYGRNPAQANTSLMLMFTCFAEPKLRILARSNQPMIEEAVDESGRSLTPTQSPRNFESSTTNSSERVFTYHVQLKKNDDATTKLARLKGRFRAVIEARNERMTIDDILAAKGTTKEIAGRQIVVGDVTESGRSYKVKLTILRDRRERRNNADSWQDNLNLNAIQLLDAGDKPLRRGGYGGGGSSEKLEYEVSFSRDRDGGPPVKLVWDLPVEAKEIDVPFEFKDLQLP